MLSLMERIGGRSKINAAVALFYQKVLADEKLRPFFHHASMNGLRAKQGMFLAMLVGGQTLYTGRDIRSAHAESRELGLDDAHFDALLTHFQQALEEVGTEPEAVREVMRLLEGTRKDVLGR
jgi:hemoglobin